MKQVTNWKRTALLLALCLSGMALLYNLPADQGYLREQAQLNSLKTILKAWDGQLKQAASITEGLAWFDDITGGTSASSWKASVQLRCHPLPCAKRIHWELLRHTPFVLLSPHTTTTLSTPQKTLAKGPSTRPSYQLSPDSPPFLSLLSTYIPPPKTQHFGQLWSLLRPTKGKISLTVELVGDTNKKNLNWKAQSSASIVTWSAILPALLAIFFVLLTSRLLTSLFLSLLFGVALFYQGNIFAAIEQTVYTYIWKNAIYQEFSFNIILFSLSLIGMVNICNRNGGIQGLIELLKGHASTPRSSRFITASLGLAVFFDDYANSIVVGNTMRPLTDRYRISREKLAYLVDSTAAPIAGIALLSTWIGYEVGLLGDLVKHLALPANVSGYSLFLSSLPFRFYCWMTLLFVFLGIFLNRDFGPMYRAEKRAWEEGKLMRDGAQPLVKVDLERVEPDPGTPCRWYNAVIPILVVLLAGFVGLLWSGGAFTGRSLQDALANANSPRVFLIASLLGSVVALLLSVTQGILTWWGAIRAWFAGARAILFAIGILIFAWSMGALSKDLGTAYYLIALLKSSLSPTLVPLLIFIMAAIISFATGTSWGTMGILLPTAAPLAFAVGGMPILVLSVGAVLDGSIFGDHCSPLSDTTLFSSAATSCDHVDHVKTQAPYALTVMAVASLFGYLAVASGLPISLSILLSIVSFVIIFFVFGRNPNAAILPPESTTTT